MLICREDACLLIIDVQEKLLPLVIEPESLVKSCEWLGRFAAKLSIPTLITEQYPQGLGATVSPILNSVHTRKVFEKVHFSVCGDSKISEELSAIKRKQLVLCGMETSVCVIQTALDLKAQGYQVFVVVDGVSGRHQLDSELALKRMNTVGVELVSKEMFFFECLRKAGSETFKVLSKEFIQ
jgi:nicotinamidase-related amidase